MKIDSMDATAMQSKNSQDTTRDVTGAKKSNLENNNTDTKKSNPNQKNVDISENVLIDAIEKANKSIVGTKTQLEFSIHEGTKEIMVKVINQETDEVVREIPSEKILDMVAKMFELAGIIVDERR
ncbi:flagellar protein FlaG [Herbivorax sp. ANBcel31]|uniref:flagellar protein FlaG n=1 Tax=Herbivorax sp. ANBcel31 TaxID=3069754 RepID=UPI0027B38DD4|nr:flagellar protein FlaG [Herbivorax sp. ANBcel31]MDQ2085091.1 flagellar protein FlaG [Herbivorax sp. ANBcel31]